MRLTELSKRINSLVIQLCDVKVLFKQGKSDGFDSCDRPSNLTQIGFNSSIFHPCDLDIWSMTSKNNKARLLYYIKLCVSFHIHQWIQTGVIVRKRPIWVKFDVFLSRVTWQCDRRMTLKNNRAPFLCYFKLCASFRSHWWIQTLVTVRKRPIWVKFDDF